MNLFNFLKSRIGAVSLNATKTAGMALVVGAVGLNFYNYMNSAPAAQDVRVRSFAEVLASGGTLPGDNSINIAMGATQFASAEEIAARQGTAFDGGEGQVAGLEGALNSFTVQGRALGAGESGLGMGANAAVELGPDGKPLAGRTGVDGSAVAAAAAAAAQDRGGASKGAPTLQRASMARASGSNLGAGNSGGFGASSSLRTSSSRSVSGTSAGTSGSYSFSGAMPEGSTLIASNSSIRGVGNTSFIAGDTKTRIGSGMKSREGKSLRDIALASAKVAANANRSDNEGSSVFLAKEVQAGGVQVSSDSTRAGGELGGGTANDSFESDLVGRENAANDALDELDLTEQEKSEHKSRLANTMIALLFTTITGMIAISALKKITPWGMIGAYALGAAILVAVGLFIADAAKYGSKYGWDGAAIGFTIGGAIMAAGVAAAMFVSGVSKWINKVMGKVYSALGVGGGASSAAEATAAVDAAVKGAGVGSGISSLRESISSSISSGEALSNSGNSSSSELSDK